MKSRSVILVSLLALPGLALAHGPSRQKFDQTITVAAPADEVWERIGDFCDIQDWHPDVASCVSEGGNEVGAVRVLTLNDEAGSQVKNELTKYDEEKKYYRYKIVDGDVELFPVTTFAGHLRVTPVDENSAKVQLKAGFYRGYTLNDPPPELNDEAAKQAVNAKYEAGLAGITSLMEGDN